MWLIRRIREKMIWKWIVLNIAITLLIIVLVGFSTKEFACYEFNQYTHSALQSHHFRQVIGQYFFEAGFIAFFAAITIHLFFAKKILTPLHRLTHVSNELKGKEYERPPFIKKDEVGQIADDLHQVSNRIHHFERQQNQMMAALAHELRTPLTTLNGYLDGLETGIFDQDESVYILLKDECRQLTDLVERMYDLEQWKHKEMENQTIEIEKTIQSAATQFQERFHEAGMTIVTRIVAMNLSSDPDALYTILSHLFQNAIRYNVGKTLKIEGQKDGDHYNISVSNQGLSIPSTAEKHLFEPFFRVEHSRNRDTGGAGLGLAIVKEIVKRLNGEVDFYTENDVHTFGFSIPIMNRKE